MLVLLCQITLEIHIKKIIDWNNYVSKLKKWAICHGIGQKDGPTLNIEMLRLYKKKRSSHIYVFTKNESIFSVGLILPPGIAQPFYNKSKMREWKFLRITPRNDNILPSAIRSFPVWLRIRWIRTGSQPYRKIMYNIVLQTIFYEY